MTNATRISIDGTEYSVEPGNYTLGELISNTGIPKDTKEIVLKTPDVKIGLAQSFQINGGETFFTAAPDVKASEVSVTTTNLADGKIGIPYSTPLHATGGKAPITFAVTTGMLPNGLTLNPNSGVISGTPATTGTSSFAVVATDSLKVASSPQSLTLVVA